MLQPDRGERLSWNPIEATFAGYRGGVAPSRYEVALADYLEKQRACRQPASRGTGGAGLVALFRRMMSQVGHGSDRERDRFAPGRAATAATAAPRPPGAGEYPHPASA